MCHWPSSTCAARRILPAATLTLLVVVAIAAGTLLWSITYTASQPAAAYFSTPARVWELALGAALALAGSRLAGPSAGWRTGLGWGGLACIVIAAVTFSGVTPFAAYAALLPTVGAALLIAAGLSAPPRRSAARVLGVLPLRCVGDRSYAFYLWHWPVLVIVAQHAGHRLSVGENLFLLLAAFALSIVSYGLFESPIRSAQWTRKGGSAGGSAQCPTWFRWAMHEGSVLHPDVTLIAGHYSYRSQVADNPSNDQALTTALDRAVLAMKKASKRVAIIADIPTLARQPVDCLLALHATPAGCSGSLTPSEPNLTSVVAQLAANDGAGLIDPTGWFCYRSQCPLVVGNLITYRDIDHLSATYAAALSGAFRAAFNLVAKPGKSA